MNPYDFYITPEEYEKAKQHDISATLLEIRIRSLGWSKHRALTTPPHEKKKLGSDWVKLAENNGICYSTLRYRTNRLGWEIERAATQPLQDRQTQAKMARESGRKYPERFIELAKQNDIPYDTFRSRIRAGWDMEKAATTPVMTSREIGLMTKTKREWNMKFKHHGYKGVYK